MILSLTFENHSIIDSHSFLSFLLNLLFLILS